VLPGGAQALIAGDGSYLLRGDGGPATAARLNAPSAAVLDASGTLWIADQGNSRIRAVSPSGTISTAAGPTGLSSPAGLALGSSGDLLIADSAGESVRSLVGSALVRVAGNGSPGYTGEGFQATGSSLLLPNGVASAAAGIFYIADTANHRIRRVNAGGILLTLAGTGVRGWNGDGYGTATQVDSPAGLALDGTGALYFADTGNNRVRKLTPDGIVTTVATGTLYQPRGVAVDAAGNVYVADTGNHRVLAVSPDGNTTVIAGTGTPGFGGDGDTATAAQLSSPSGLFIDSATGSIYVADSGNQRIRRLTPAPGAPTEAAVANITVVNAATLLPGPVAACSLVSVFGINAGAAGTQVLFDGQPAATVSPLPNQISAQVPCAVANQSATRMQLNNPGAPFSAVTLAVANAAPGLFALGGGTGQAVATNQDGTVNSQANPARAGSVVTLYATGAGQNNSLGVIVGTRAGTLQFSGDAPGLIGLTQINVQLPPDATGVQPVVLLAGNVPSQAGVTLAIE
ncbi:MAG: repeat containing protein, partial [Bryobacterales bacterium]|nr:repeat containing protein [Bryobacterales bacterium]